VLEENGEDKMVQVRIFLLRSDNILDDLTNRIRYWDLKEEAEDQKRWKQQFINRKRK
jgi:hypothetical protein